MTRPLQPAPGTGKTKLVDHVSLRLGILRGLSRFFESNTDAQGVLRCKRHRVEHTGKNVYAALIHLMLWRYSREEEPLEAAKRVVLHTVDMLGEDPDSKVPVFLPGRVDPRNASTNAIDGGACADVLATVLEEVPELFSESERARITDALVQHVEGYLRHAARERPITAQRLWAGTGTARAARLLGRDDWAADALAGAKLALEELAPDGVAPYIPAHTDHCTHPGLADISGFYHSRTPGFVLAIHEFLDAPLSDWHQERLRASLDALVAFRDGLGRKLIQNEAKAWYWESDYEVASHPFDAYALHVGARRLERPLYENEAGRVMQEWIAHLSKLDGGVLSHHGRGTNFQCRIFWSGHAAWVARILHDVPLRAAPREPLQIELAQSGLLHVERPGYTAVLRGSKAPHGNLFGPDVGGGSLQSLVVSDPAPRELVPLQRFERARVGSALLRPTKAPGRLRRWLRLLSAERGDLRFRLFVMRVEFGAGRWFGAPLYLLRHAVLRTWGDASPEFAAHCDTETTCTHEGDEVVYRGALALPDGTRWEGSATERRYRFEERSVALDDRVTLSGVHGRLRYQLPADFELETATAEGADLEQRGRWLSLRASGGALSLRVVGRFSA
ncbi:MAG: hypothetical protein DHS20C15_21520 [Planctomycetota bacterium]|nr:MAG: hypothetical protein DHS20C15_21520 [Planctomycetota bacterium]